MDRLNICPTPMWGCVPLMAAFMGLAIAWADVSSLWYWYDAQLSPYQAKILWLAPLCMLAALAASFALAVIDSHRHTETELT